MREKVDTVIITLSIAAVMVDVLLLVSLGIQWILIRLQ